MALARLRPRDADVLSNLGIALAGSGRITEATAAFTRAVDVDPGQRALAAQPARLHCSSRTTSTGASRHGREAVPFTPGDPPAHNLLDSRWWPGPAGRGDPGFETSLTLQRPTNDAAAYLERTPGATAVFGAGRSPLL
jgi:hypothetical protein